MAPTDPAPERPDQTQQSGQRTLLASVILSAPGPLVLGIALFFGRSTTQLADFVRRTAELVAIVVSWVIYRITTKDGGIDAGRRHHLERIADLSVGAAMIISGVIMLLVTLLADNAEKGNVIPGLVIAGLGVVFNSWFWWRYSTLNRREPNAILAVQSRLYRAKALVDAAVTAALVTIVVAPGSAAAHFMDKAGSGVVAIYLMFSGIQAARQKRPVMPPND